MKMGGKISLEREEGEQVRREGVRLWGSGGGGDVKMRGNYAEERYEPESS